MSAVTEVWSTIKIAMRGVGTDPATLAAAADRLEGLAALLANSDEVGGVETRDPSLITEGPEFTAVEQPELIAYTTPAARATVEAAARELASALTLEIEIESEDHEGDDWRDVWKRYHRSLYFHAAGPTKLALLIRPSWIERRADDPELELILDPGRAFGTGLHESTRLCLQALVELAGREAGGRARVLDLGCGSGILGLAAARLWPALAKLELTDHDPEAVATAHENAELNGLIDPQRVAFRRLDLLADADAFEAPTPAQLVFANIRPMVLIPAAARIVAALAPDGLLVLSGVLEEEAEAVLAAYAGALELVERHSEAGWTALVMARRGPR